jgi:hypothetical protein
MKNTKDLLENMEKKMNKEWYQKKYEGWGSFEMSMKCLTSENSFSMLI